MKTAKFLMAILSVVLILSCNYEQATDKNINKPPIITGDTTDNSYFPLQVGNEWIYQVNGDTIEKSLKVVDSAEIEDNEYFIIIYRHLLEPDNQYIEDTLFIGSSDGKKYYK